MTGFEPAASCSQTRRDTNFAIPEYFFSIPQLRVEGKRKFLVYINKVVIGGRRRLAALACR